MKRHIQKTGVRKFFGGDLVELQAEPLKALDAFFAEYGTCVIEGCAIAAADGGTFDVSPGLVALEATDPESGAVAIRTMPFGGAQGVALPLYLSGEWLPIERVYGDGKVKPIGYDLRAVASGVAPEGPHLVLSAAGGNRFVDALQDPAHRFVSDTERSKWNGVLHLAQEYAAVQAEAAKRSAIEHTNATAAAVRDELALADQAAVRSAKQYADQIVAALVDGSPELLNTLEELAGALGGDPNFATTVMTEIGKRAQMTEVHAAMEGKANAAEAMIHRGTNVGESLDDCTQTGYYFDMRGPALGTLLVVRAYNNTAHPMQILVPHQRSGLYTRSYDTDTKSWSEWVEVWHSGNFDPEGSIEKSFSAKTIGFENECCIGVGNSISSAYDPMDFVVHADQGRRLLLMGSQLKFSPSIFGPRYDVYHSGNLKIIRGSVDASGYSGNHNAVDIRPDGAELVWVTHNLGHSNYVAVATVVAHSDQARRDNVVTVYQKGNNDVWFLVTDGFGSTQEKSAFDFLIIPL